MGQGASDSTQLAVVNDVLGGLRAEGLIEGYRPQGLREQREFWNLLLAFCDAMRCAIEGRIPTRDLPFRTVLRPQSYGILILGDAQLALDLDDTGTKVLPPLSNLSVRLPDVLGLPGLSDGIPWSPS